MKNRLKHLIFMGVALVGCDIQPNHYYNVSYVYDIEKSEYQVSAYENKVNKLGEWRISVERTYHVYPHEQFYKDGELIENELYVRENKLIFYHYRY